MGLKGSKRMKKVAVTGGIGSGKSALCLIFQKWGQAVIYADAYSKQALDKNSTLYPKFLKLFQEKELKLDKIAEKIFSDSKLKQSYEKLIHPYIFQCIVEKENFLKKQGFPIIFYEIPLLFETRLSYYFDFIVLVVSTKKEQKERIMKKMNLSEKQALQRINSQIPYKEKIKKSHFIVKNSGSLSHLEVSAKRLMDSLSLKKRPPC